MTEGDAVFRIGDVFPADDPLARYVVRLSTALGDLRLAARPLIPSFEETPDHMRMYQLRITAGHASEFVQLIEPQTTTVLPTLDDVLNAVGDVHPPFATVVLSCRAELVGLLNATLPDAHATLRRELNRLRQQAFHYGYKRGNDVALRKAMAAAADLEGRYLAKPGDQRGCIRRRDRAPAHASTWRIRRGADRANAGAPPGGCRPPAGKRSACDEC